jgi:hypothetical protein
MFRSFIILYLSGMPIMFGGFQDKIVPIYFSESGITLHSIPRMMDTLYYNKGEREDFKFVFYDNRGKCYCERYINKKLYEKGYYENSPDTLIRYVSVRFSTGKSSPRKAQRYFQPLKNGIWTVYRGGKEVKEEYFMGVLQNPK